jgi:hypothetical protein
MTLMAYNYHADDNVQDTLHKRERKWNEEVEEAQDSGSMEWGFDLGKEALGAFTDNKDGC